MENKITHETEFFAGFDENAQTGAMAARYWRSLGSVAPTAGIT
jgi:hypothetical protein